MWVVVVILETVEGVAVVVGREGVHAEGEVAADGLDGGPWPESGDGHGLIERGFRRNEASFSSLRSKDSLIDAI